MPSGAKKRKAAAAKKNKKNGTVDTDPPSHLSTDQQEESVKEQESIQAEIVTDETAPPLAAESKDDGISDFQAAKEDHVMEAALKTVPENKAHPDSATVPKENKQKTTEEVVDDASDKIPAHEPLKGHGDESAILQDEEVDTVEVDETITPIINMKEITAEIGKEFPSESKEFLGAFDNGYVLGPESEVANPSVGSEETATGTLQADQEDALQAIKECISGIKRKVNEFLEALQDDLANLNILETRLKAQPRI